MKRDLTRRSPRSWDTIVGLTSRVAKYVVPDVVRFWNDERAWKTMWEWRVPAPGNTELAIIRLEKFVGR